MGSSGAFLDSGGFSEYKWEEEGTFHGIKILVKKNANKKPSLPFYSNTPGTGYLLLNGKGVFKQFRQFGENRKPIYDLEYNEHKHKLSLHLHYYANGRQKEPIIIALPNGKIINKKLYNKFKPLLKGIKL